MDNNGTEQTYISTLINHLMHFTPEVVLLFFYSSNTSFYAFYALRCVM